MRRTSLLEAARRLVSSGVTVIGPQRVPPADVFFGPVESASELALDYGNTLISPTSLLLPAREELFTVRFDESGAPQVISDLEEPDQIILGIRPCDVAAIAYLDRFFLGGEVSDSLYAARRRGTRLVALACDVAAHEHCFCSCCESGPVAEGGYDVQLSPVGDGYLVEVGSEEGARIVELWADLLAPAPPELAALRDKAAEELRTEMQDRASMPAGIRRVTAGAVEDEVWETIGDRCISCSSCSLVCPKCSCFHVVDEVEEDGTVARVRRWDSCRLAGFTREASGVNPREEPSARAFRYSYHKLSYRYVEEMGVHGCVGCGRCAIVCMGAVDMPRVAQMIRRGV
jgi:ferredoxin